MEDARNLTTIATIGNYAKNKASVAKSKSLETKSTFEVEHPDTKKKTKVELTQAQADKVNEQKTPEKRKEALKAIVDEKVQTGELAPEFINGTPVVDKFKLKVWESAPIKGKAVTTKKVEVDKGYKHNTDDASAWSRYLAKTREAN
jgi:phosphoenolpyruvate carboxylase